VPFLLIFLFTLLTFVLLFTFRSADDNRLTSWQWVFSSAGTVTVFIALFAGLSLALLCSRVSFPLRLPSLILFLSSFFIAALFWREPEVIVDASRYFTQAKHLEVYGIGYFFREWGKTVQSWTDLPLVPFLYGLIFRFIGESRLYIQIFTASLFSLTVVLTYRIGKELWDDDTGVMGGAFLLGMPYLFTQVPLMLVDVPTMFFLILAIFTFIRGMERGGWTIAVSSVSLFLAFFSKYSTWPMLSVLAVIFVVYLGKSAPAAAHPRNLPLVREGTGGIATAEGDMNVMDRKAVLSRGIMIVALALVMTAGAVLYKYDVFSEQIRLLLHFQKPGLKKWGESFLSTLFFQIHPFITVSALFSFYVAFRKRDIRYAIISWLVVMLVVFQVKRIRYTLPLFPMVALMASYGLQYVQDKDVRRFVVLCAVVSSLSVSLFGYLPFSQRISTVNLKTAGEFLDTMDGKKVEVYTLYEKDPVLNPAVAVPLLDLFTRKQIVYRYERTSSHGEEHKNSPLRFTWEYKNPEYYRGGNEYGGLNMPVVVLSGSPVKTIPEEIRDRLRGYRLLREFDTYEGVYGFRTVVSVYTAQS
jgi:hypothetical protein